MLKIQEDNLINMKFIILIYQSSLRLEFFIKNMYLDIFIKRDLKIYFYVGYMEVCEIIFVFVLKKKGKKRRGDPYEIRLERCL